MKAFLLFNLLFFSVFCAFSQDYLSIANDCYEKGDYDCARDNFQNYLKKLPNDEDVKVLRKKAGECSMYKVVADKAYNEKDYQEAIENYSAILDINPHDSFAKARLKECNNILNPVSLAVSSQKLTFDSSGGNEMLIVSTNSNTYLVTELPEWCSYSSNAEIISVKCAPNTISKSRTGYIKVAAEDKEVKIEVSQSGFETTLNLSTTNLSFKASGGNTSIMITSNSNTYDISLLPKWCSVIKNIGYFLIYCEANYTGTSRIEWFKVTSGEKEIWVKVDQAGSTSKVKSTQNKTSKTKSVNCFNCPFEKYTLGFSMGYVDKKDPNYYDEFNMQGFQIGFRIEPLFKYGFGINTGIFYEFFSSTLNESLFYNNNFNDEFEQHVISIPLHLEYRLNFSKYFNVFAYGGGGFDFVMDAFNYNNNFIPSFEFGGGLRINHLQFNIGQSLQVTQIEDINDFKYLYNYLYKGLNLSVSYMF